MKSIFKSTLGICIALGALSFGQGVARASDPVAVYALIDKVIFEPNAGAQERIQIFGVFALPDLNSGSLYLEPQRGYLYFTLPPGKEGTARKEWADLKEIAGKKQVAGFGSRWELRTRVRKADEKPASPDVYQLSLGVVRVRTDTDYAPIKALLDFASH